VRGHIRQRYKGTWSIVLDLGRRVDPKTGLLKRVQKWFTFRGTRKQAEGKLTTLLHGADRGQVIEASKLTVGDGSTNG
jgi:integrase